MVGPATVVQFDIESFICGRESDKTWGVRCESLPCRLLSSSSQVIEVVVDKEFKDVRRGQAFSSSGQVKGFHCCCVAVRNAVALASLAALIYVVVASSAPKSGYCYPYISEGTRSRFGEPCAFRFRKCRPSIVNRIWHIP